MDTQRKEATAAEAGVPTQRTGRRGLVAAAAVLVAGIAVERSAVPVRAASDTNYTATGGVGTAFTVNTLGYGIGVDAYGTVIGVEGLTGSGTGVYGYSNTSIGVQGTSPISTGVYGTSGSGIAVNGESTSGPGVRGTTAAGSADDGGRFLADRGRGVAGFTNSGIGAYGTATSGIGVRAFSDSGIGLVVEAGASSTSQAISVLHNGSGPGLVLFAPQNHGIVASTAKAGYGGFNGNAIAAGAAGVIGTGSNGAYAGYFTGPVVVNGQQVVTGSKSAAVPHPDGTHRLLYCVESPEAWFEDFGEGTITGGKGEVKLDPDFAAVVDTSKMHVFAMAHDEHHALHIAGKSATGFTVGVHPSAVGIAASKKAADLSGTFTYRVVAKRKDVKAERLAKFTLPMFAPPPKPTHPPLPSEPHDTPKLPMLPTPPTPPKSG